VTRIKKPAIMLAGGLVEGYFLTTLSPRHINIINAISGLNMIDKNV